MKLKPVHFYLFSIIISLSIICGSIYYFLGGFDEINVYELQGEDRIVIGKHFQGKQNDIMIEEYFRHSRALILDSAIIGTLSIVVNETDSLAPNEVDYFIGIVISGEMAEVPRGFTVREYQSTRKLAIFLAMHPIVRPSPRRINKLFEAKANELDMELSNYKIELHYHDDTMSIEAWEN